MNSEKYGSYGLTEGFRMKVGTEENCEYPQFLNTSAIQYKNHCGLNNQTSKKVKDKYFTCTNSRILVHLGFREGC
jgi:hypothetical protein